MEAVSTQSEEEKNNQLRVFNRTTDRSQRQIVFSSWMSALMLFACLTSITLMLSLFMAWWISSLLEQANYGFFIVAGLNLLLLSYFIRMGIRGARSHRSYRVFKRQRPSGEAIALQKK